MKPLNFAKLNHILIPSTKAERDRFRRGRFGRALAPIVRVLESLSDEGRLVALCALAMGAFSLDVRHTEMYALWSALVGLLVASLAIAPLFRLDGVRAEVSVPRRVTVGQEIRFALTLRNEGGRKHHAIRLRGPFLPWDGRWTSDAPRVRRLAPGETAHVEFAGRFVARGEHHLDAFHLAPLAPLGLAMGRRIATSGCRFLVVPKVANVVRLKLASGLKHQPNGVALASKTGQSMDLLGVRPYRIGDPVRDLHARSWARHGAPVVREYQEEYFRRIGVVVDTQVRKPSRRGDDPERMLEASLSLAAGAIAHLSLGEALVDLLVVGDKMHDLTLGRSVGFLEQALDLLACVEHGQSASHASHAPLDTLMAQLEPHLPKLSALLVIALGSADERITSRVGGYGVACRTMVVVSERTVDHSGDREGAEAAFEIGVDEIERGEALSL